LNKLIGVILSACLLTVSAYGWAEDAPVSYGNDPGTKALRVDDSEVKTDFGQDKPVEKSGSKSKSKKLKIGIKNNAVKPEDMKSYHRSESGDVSAQ